MPGLSLKGSNLQDVFICESEWDGEINTMGLRVRSAISGCLLSWLECYDTANRHPPSFVCCYVVMLLPPTRPASMGMIDMVIQRFFVLENKSTYLCCDVKHSFSEKYL